MYFSKGKSQSAQPSLADLRHSATTTRPSSSIQKNNFNFNIYFTANTPHQQSPSQQPSTQFNSPDGAISPLLLHRPLSNENNVITSKPPSSYLIPPKTSTQSSPTTTKMHLSFHKFKKIADKRNVTSISHHQLLQKPHLNTSNLSSNSRSVSRVQLIGYSEDPEFQHVKATSEQIVAANNGLLQVKTDEISTELEYDMRIKQLKRSSSAFLPAYKAFKTSSSSTSLHSQSNQPSVQQMPVPQSANRRPFYFLTDKNEPLFSLKQLEQKFVLKQKAKEIIESSEEEKSSSIHFQKQLLIRNSLFSENHAEFRVSKPIKTNGLGLTNHHSISKLNLNFTPDNFGEKKFVYLSLKTALKGRDSLTSNSSLAVFSSLDMSTFKSDFSFISTNASQTTASAPLLYHGGEPFKLVIELYTKVAPKACENFLKLCEGSISSDGNYLTFRNTNAVRFKKNGFIQLGFAKPGISIYPNGYFEDESFAITHDQPGILGYCNRGTPHSNSSQFYITLGEMKSFDKKMVAFGRVISGFKHLEKINKIVPPSAMSEIPPFSIVVCDSGIAQSRPSTNQSRISSNSSTSIFRSPNSLARVIDPMDLDIPLEEEYRVVQPEIFQYNGEKATKLQTYEAYVIGEAEKHKEVANAEHISLMMGLQSIALLGKEILTYSYQYKTIEEIRNALKQSFVSILSECQSVALLYDIIDDEVFIESNTGKFVLAFTSIDVTNLADLSSCGSMFIIFRKTTTSFRPAKRADLLQSGEAIYGAGYFFYGQATQMVFHTGFRLNCFTYDPENNFFVLTHPRIKTPKRSGIISCDESKLSSADENMTKFIKRKKMVKETYVSRYIGSSVADFHRTLLYGGILVFPLKEVNIYEAFILSYLIEKAWDRSSSGQDGQILIKKPIDCTESVQLYLGHSTEVLEIDNLYLQIRRKNSLYIISELSSQQTIKSFYRSPKSQIPSPKTKAH